MDDEAALRARQVALAASAWLGAPADHEAYRRLVDAVEGWDNYCALSWPSPPRNCSTTSAPIGHPSRLSEIAPDVLSQLRTAARRVL